MALRLGLAAVLSLAVLAAPPAYAQDAFAAFRQLCLETEADGSRALSATQAMGWEPMAEHRLAELAALSSIANASARVRPTSGGVFVLLVGQQSEDGIAGAPASVCVVHVFAQREIFDAIAVAQAWVGLSPVERMGQGARWEFAMVGGESRALEDAPEAEAAFGLIAYSDRQRTQFELARAELR